MPDMPRAEESPPTLIGELRLLDEEWGEGFREDVAAPLARIIKGLRESLKKANENHEKELDSKDDVIDGLENSLDESRAEANAYKELMVELEDVPRGVRTVEEVLQKHDVAT